MTHEHHWIIESVKELQDEGMAGYIDASLYCKECNSFADGVFEIKDGDARGH